MDGIFTTQLLRWYAANKRDLPWRLAPSPYGVWISEIMAQQTQIDRVVHYYDRWMAHFPDIDSLARANEDDVLNLWEGLGYYSRARNILKATQLVANEFGGVFPAEYADIRSLPGVGEYTAGAVSSIAFGQCETAVDANVLRVFSRLLDVGTPVREKAARKAIDESVRFLMPEDRPGDFNQAIMELGALVCTKRPRCRDCPVAEHCLALERGTVADRPMLPKARETIHIDMATGVLVHEGRVLVQKRCPDDVWPGLWEFPGGVIEEGESPKQALVREYREEVELDVSPGEKLTVVSYSYTRYRVTMHCYLCRLANGTPPSPVFNEAVEGGFVTPSSLSDFAFPAGHRRLIEFLRQNSLL